MGHDTPSEEFVQQGIVGNVVGLGDRVELINGICPVGKVVVTAAPVATLVLVRAKGTLGVDLVVLILGVKNAIGIPIGW